MKSGGFNKEDGLVVIIKSVIQALQRAVTTLLQ